MKTLAFETGNVDLAEEVRKLVAQVPEGKVTTYGKVAEALGDIVASRFVGKVMSENDDIVRVPCRRVVQSDGTIGGYTGGGGVEGKKKLLREEGIKIEGNNIVDFEKVLFKDFKTSYPLQKFKEIQKRDLAKLSLKDDFADASIIAGSDIAYDDEIAYGSLVLFDRKTKKKIDVLNMKTKANFPYIPTYLTFREAEIISKLVTKSGKDMILVHDGNGIMHPLGFGIASHLGVMLEIPTIGVAKKLLSGKVSGKGETKKVTIEGKHVGYAVMGESWSAPVYISPGNRISVHSSLSLLQPFWHHRIPEPVRIAHTEAEKFRRENK